MEDEEKTNIQAARENARKHTRPILKLQEQLILDSKPGPGGHHLRFHVCAVQRAAWRRRWNWWKSGLVAAWEALLRSK